MRFDPTEHQLPYQVLLRVVCAPEHHLRSTIIFSGALGMFILHLQYLQFCRLIESIKNSKYLVGQRLVNYDPSSRRENKTATSTALKAEEEKPEGQNL